MKLAVLVASGLVALAFAGSDQRQEKSHDDDSSAAVEPSEVVEERLQSSRREERLFAFFTTTSVKRLATTTITALSTCLSITTNPPPCTGRKKRSLFNSFSNPIFPEMTEEDLTGSYEDPEGVSMPREIPVGREGKKLTVWSTFSSTLTLTSTSYVAGTTVTATALCIAPGLTAGCFGK